MENRGYAPLFFRLKIDFSNGVFMAKKQLISGWEYLGGKSQRYREIATGREISRRQYDKLDGQLSYEKKAAHNKIINPELSAIRPARGRKSYLKSEEWAKKEIAEQRIEAQRLKKEKAEKEKQQRKVERANVRLSNKKVRVKKVKKHLIPKGQIGWRIAFNEYSELETLLDEAKKTNVIFAYGLGFVGVDTRIGELRSITVFRLRPINRGVDEDEFNEAMAEAIEEYSYMMPSHYFVHFAIDKNFAASRK